MADKDFGIKRLNLVGASGTPTITSPTDLIIRANNVAISTNSTIGGNLGIGTTNPTSRLTVQGDALVSGILTASRIVGTSLSISGISTIANFLITNVGTGATVGGIGVVTYYGDGSKLTDVVSGYADNAGIATNLKGGLTGNVPYQLSPGITTFVDNSSATPTQVLRWNGSVPVWGDISAGSIVGVVTYADRAGIATYADYAGIATNVIGGIASVSQLNVSGITTLGVTTISQLYVSGVSTFVGAITGTISTATKLENPRIFEITGDVVASPIFFDGTDNVSLAATIQPNSVELGVDTFGDYVKDISGTANQITVTGGMGEGSTPILSIPNQFTAPQDVTVSNDLQVNRNLNVNGNITVGGTSAILFTQTFKVYDSDIILGVRTDGNGNDISTDNSANHGGIAIASTDGNPLVTLTNPGVGETLPATYKKFMWFKAGSFAGLGTDAWLSNYAIGIGSTQFPTGTRLAAGSVQFTENDLAVVRNINASGIITATEFKGTLTGYASSAGIVTNLGGGAAGNVVYQYNTGITSFVDNSSATSTQVLRWNGSAPVWGDISAGSIVGVVTYADRAGIATYADNAGIATNLKGGVTGNIPYQLNTDTTTFVDNSSATPTQVLRWNGSVPVWGDISAGSIVGVVTYADRSGIADNVIGGIASVSQLNVTGITTLASIVGTSLSITGISTLGVTTTTNLTSQQLNVSGITTLASIVGTSLSISGISTLGITSTTNLTSQQLLVTGITTLASIVGTSLSISGISTIANFLMTPVGTGATVGGIGVTYYGDGSQLINISSSSIVGIITYADRAGIATNVIGGIASVTSLDVSGITTLRSIVGTSLSISGISTIANFRITNVGTGATVGGVGVLTYYGDGSQLTGLIAGVSISTNTTNQSQLIPYVTGTGSTTGFGVTTLFTYNPSSGNLGIGTTTPTSKLTVVGDVLVSGVLTATRLYSGIYGEFVGGSISGSDIVGTSLSITGISTLGTVKISSGIITSTTGIVTYYGDGRNLTNVVGAFGGIGTAGGTVGTGITFLDFRGSGISSITVSSGIATITIPGASRSGITSTAAENQTSFPATYSVGYADVYLNGSKLSSTEYTATNGTSIELTEPASAGDIVEIVSYLINITGGSSTPDISPVMMGMIF